MFNFSGFSIARIPRIEFGTGIISKLPSLIKRYGDRVLLVTGNGSFTESEYWSELSKQLEHQQIKVELCRIRTEPSPDNIDNMVSEYRNSSIDVVVAIGGGSALDAGKAIAGLLRLDNPVADFLEGVGPELTYQGPAVPFIAVPTTAGTGSEATKNAVLSEQSMQGYKKSFRDDKLVAEYALLDPDLLASCKPSHIAANGMDALTQLMESFVSTRSNPMTDALATSGLVALRDSLLPWYRGENSVTNRSAMAYASLMSGITLAQTGLGSVHGLASPMGAFFPIPHGVVCGTLVAPATETNIMAMQHRDENNSALIKYARLGNLLSGKQHKNTDNSLKILVELLYSWTEEMKLPKLGRYGVKLELLEHVVAHSRGSSMKTNPIKLTDDELRKILISRL